MSPHLIVPFAAASGDACHAILPKLELPHLQRLLQRWHPAGDDRGDDYSLSTPHERALARTLGWPELPDGTLPWAAWESGVNGVASTWFTPCHWSVGMEQVTLLPPGELDLREDESRALLEALRPFCAEDGITLTYEAPDRWLATGDWFEQQPCASLDRVAHRRVDAWLPRDGRVLRLQNEAQMLFYTHPVNDTRTARGVPAVNGFWLSGTGTWQSGWSATEPAPLVPQGLRHAALRGDWAAWQQAWAVLDATEINKWLERAERGEALQLTLCGEHSSRTWQSTAPGDAPRPGWTQRLLGKLRPAAAPRVQDALKDL